jgi:cytochrome bd ubiquinol oxidase subunit I
VSPSVSLTSLIISLAVFALLYLGLAVLDVTLMLRFSRRELAPAPPGPPARSATAAPRWRRQPDR